MGTPIAGKSHTSPLVGTEKVPLSPDGFATTGEIAGLATGGGLTTVTRDLSTAEIATLASSPVDLVAAQGAGTAVVPAHATFQFIHGDEPFGALEEVYLGWGSGQQMELGTITFDDAIHSRLLSGAPVMDGTPELADAEDLPLVVALGANPQLTGSVLTSSILDAGTDYVAGDEVTMIQSPLLGDAVVAVVDTVDVGGVVLTYHLTDNGTRNKVGDARGQQSTTGIGTGFGINVDSITPLSDGTGRITVLYYVMDLA